MTRTGQRALIHAARSCATEAARADRLGHRRYAANLRASARRALDEAGQDGDPLVRAIGSVKKASALADGLPDRDTDTEGHDECVKAVHGHVQSARSYLEAHLNPNGLPSKALRSLRRRGGRSGPSGPSGTDDDVSYQPVSGHPDLLRALDSLAKASDEADQLADLLDNEAERDKSARDLHFHCKAADESFQSYHDLVIADPEAEKRRSVARAWAQTIATGLH
jgi:hypothetical protein